MRICFYNYSQYAEILIIFFLSFLLSGVNLIKNIRETFLLYSEKNILSSTYQTEANAMNPTVAR